jgi:hypothetical protein
MVFISNIFYYYILFYYELDPLRTGILLCDKEKLYIKLQALLILNTFTIYYIQLNINPFIIGAYKK